MWAHRHRLSALACGLVLGSALLWGWLPWAGAAAPSDAGQSSPATEAASATDVLSIGTCAASERASGVLRFSLAHFNDLHARYSDRLLGHSRYAYLAGLLTQLKAQRPQTLVLDAGDDYEKGAITDLRSQGEATRRLLHALPIDVRTIGNHDFAYGEEALLRDVRDSRAPVLAANLRHLRRAADDQPFLPSVQRQVGCVRVGIIGLVTEGYGADDRPSPEPYYQVLIVDSQYAEVLRRQAGRLRPQVDVLIALTHLGHREDLRLAEQLAEVDLLVGAHSKDLLRQPLAIAHPGGRRTWVLRAGHDGDSLGLGDVRVDLAAQAVTFDSYKIVAINETLPVLPALTEQVAAEERRYAPDTHVAIASAHKAIRRAQMSALLFRAAQAMWQVDALILGHDVFFAGLPAGRLTLQQLYEPVRVQRQPSGTPGFSSLSLITVSGRQLAALQQQVRGDADYGFHVARGRLRPDGQYRIAVEKRLLHDPSRLFTGSPVLPAAQHRGELIDLLEAYARARSAAGQPLLD